MHSFPLPTSSISANALPRLRLLQHHLPSQRPHRQLLTSAMSTVTPKIKLYTQGTPNGYKISILLEELKAAYGLEYMTKKLDFQKNEQKEPWFLEINPNGRIPAIVDETRGGFKVFETAAITLYLTQHYDPEFKFSFDPVKDANDYSEALQWIFFIHGGVGPMQGQAVHFFRYAPEKIPYGVNRYITETKRLYSVLESRLSSRDYLAGTGRGKYSIADMNGFPWVRGHAWAGITEEEFEKDFPNLKKWLGRIEERKAVYEGLGVPVRHQKMTKEDEEEAVKEAQKWILTDRK